MISRLDQIVSSMALSLPDNTAIIEPPDSITYRKLEGKVRTLSGHLLGEGLNKGERVGILSRNSITSSSLFFAIFRAGGVAVPLNHTLDSSDIIKQANNSAICAIYVGKGLEEKGRKVIHSANSIRFVVKDMEKGKGAGDYPVVNENELASIIYTSGTSRDPVGVMLSHKNIISNSASIVKYMNISAADSICCVLPFYYIFGLSILFSYFLAGAAVIIDNRFMYPNTILDTIDNYKATGFAGVSSHYVILLHKSDLKKRKLLSLKYFTQAGDSMPASITKELISAFPEKKFYIMYGQTEASPRLTYLDPALVKTKPDSIGKAIPGVEIKLVNEDGFECGIGEEGEIIARGDNIMLGYWNNPDETSKAIKEGWLYTGDLAVKDKDGDLFITGRRKDFIKIGANRVNPVEIEKIIMENSRVMEAVALGVDDAILGKKIKLFISLVRGEKMTGDEALKFCKDRLPSYKAPSEIVILESIPKNSYGKVDTKKLTGIKCENR